MTRFAVVLLFVAAGLVAEAGESASAPPVVPSEAEGWVSLFNGRDLSGWQANENAETFSVEEGLLLVDGPRSHLFYTGEVNNGVFRDFELLVEVKTEPRANSGIFFHTEWQDRGWPAKGYEAQVNQTHGDPRKDGRPVCGRGRDEPVSG